MIKFWLFLFVATFFQQDESLMLWSTSSPLSWSDFKGLPEKKIDAVASTASGITFSYSIKKSNNRVVSFTTQVFGYFYPHKSWVIVEKADLHILAHEQLHFDITELHVRMFKQQIERQKTSNTISTELDYLHKKINIALSKMQNRYDKESDYSRNLSNEAFWQEFIKKELQKLSKYKS